MTERKYMEDTSFELPVRKNGVQGLGDLWNCRESVPLNLNLFSKNLDDKYLRATVIGDKKQIYII